MQREIFILMYFFFLGWFCKEHQIHNSNFDDSKKFGRSDRKSGTS